MRALHAELEPDATFSGLNPLLVGRFIEKRDDPTCLWVEVNRDLLVLQPDNIAFYARVRAVMLAAGQPGPVRRRRRPLARLPRKLEPGFGLLPLWMLVRADGSVSKLHSRWREVEGKGPCG